MTRNELFTIIGFIEQTRTPAIECLGVSVPDPYWNMVLFLLKRHLENKLVTVTSLAAVAGVPYGTAMRKIDELMESGLLIKRPRTQTGKSFSLHPSQYLVDRFQEFAIRIKVIVGRTFGFVSETGEPGDYYFGGSYMAARIIAAPTIMKNGIGVGSAIRLLTNRDQTFIVWKKIRTDLEHWLGGQVRQRILSLDQLREETLANAQLEISEYDIIDFDLPWIGEYDKAGVLLPLDDFIDQGTINAPDFHPAAWDGAHYGDRQLGIPVMPTPELLFYRKDLFGVAGIDAPQTVNAVLAAARALHDPKAGINGIAWCAGRGTPIGHTFVQVLGAFGRPPLNLTAIDTDFDLSEISGEALRPTIDTPEGLMTANYLLELLAYSPPEILDMAWDETIQVFAEGGAAMIYGWSGRASRFELNRDSPVSGNTGYLPHPHGPGMQHVSPMGGYALGIPANLDPDRVDLAWRVIEFLTSPELIKVYVQNGSLVSPRFSVSADPEVSSTCSIIDAVDQMAKAGQLQYWPRPPVPEFAEMIGVLGEEIHDMLQGKQSPRRALKRSQKRIDNIMRAHGHY